ncbi:unnamed protein product, partial [Ectocarpus sp. 8 AP-2014]
VELAIVRVARKPEIEVYTPQNIPRKSLLGRRHNSGETPSVVSSCAEVRPPLGLHICKQTLSVVNTGSKKRTPMLQMPLVHRKQQYHESKSQVSTYVIYFQQCESGFVSPFAVG